MKTFALVFIVGLLSTPLAFAQGNKLRPLLRTISEKQSAQYSFQSAQRVLEEAQNGFPALRHVNRQQAKQLPTRFRPQSQDVELWAKLKTGYLTTRSNNKSLLVNKIVQRHTNMSSALIDVRKLEKIYGKQDFFLLFTTAYYKREMGEMSPSLYEALQRIYLQNDPSKQDAAVARMQFLFQNKNRLLSVLQEGLPQRGVWRLQWLPEFAAARSAATDINRIILAYERTLKPFRKDIALDHINAASTVRIKEWDAPIVYYPGDLKFLPLVYKHLLYEEQKGQPIFVTVDKKNRSMIIFNSTKDKWVRISTHEYSNPNNLHLHLNQLKKVHFKTAPKSLYADRVLLNIQIPIQSRPDLTPQELEEFFFDKALETMSKMSNVYISYQSVP